MPCYCTRVLIQIIRTIFGDDSVMLIIGILCCQHTQMTILLCWSSPCHYPLCNMKKMFNLVTIYVLVALSVLVGVIYYKELTIRMSE